MNLFKITLITLVFLFSTHSHAADLFDSIQPNSGTISPRPTVNSFHDINVNFDALIEVPNTLDISLPDSLDITVTMKDFDYRRGWEWREEDDPPGPPVYIIPGFPIEDMSYKWSGGNDEWDVLLSVTKGVLYGVITSNDKRFGISKIVGNDYTLVDYNLSAFRPVDGGAGNPIPSKSNVNQEPSNPKLEEATISDLRSYDFSNSSLSDNRSIFTNLDVLIIWTEDARVDAGGDPGNVNDTADIDALMVSAIDHANDALSNSESNTRTTKFHTAKLNGFVYHGSTVFPVPPNAFAIDLENLTALASVQNLRNQVGADVVTAIMAPDASVFSPCGVAWVQTYPTCSDVRPDPSCDTGVDFEDFTYNITVQECVLWTDAYTHELGHLMGANHIFSELASAWRTAVINNGYPEAFGYTNSTFRSIMSVTNVTSRRLNFSNPSVTVNGVVTGVTGSADNTLTIDTLSPTMEAYRTRPDLIFENGFE